jgi:hypothetical protein
MLKKHYNKETKTLHISNGFNEELKDIPKETEIILFSYSSNFTQSVDNLPENLTHLTFGYWFNQSVDNLPLSLTHLTFGCCFNQLVDNLPKTLTHLTFGYMFNQSVDNLPEKLTHLIFNVRFNQSIDNLPKKIKELTLICNHKSINNLPDNIEKLHIYFSNRHSQNKNIQNLPITLKEIIIEKEEYKKYLIKIPFDTVIIIKKIEK